MSLFRKPARKQTTQLYIVWHVNDVGRLPDFELGRLVSEASHQKEDKLAEREGGENEKREGERETDGGRKEAQENEKIPGRRERGVEQVGEGEG